MRRVQTDFILLNCLLLPHLPILGSFNLEFLFLGEKQQSESRLVDCQNTSGIYKALCYTAQLKCFSDWRGTCHVRALRLLAIFYVEKS